MLIFEVTLKNQDSEKCKVEVLAANRRQALDLAEVERGKGWLAIEAKEVIE